MSYEEEDAVKRGGGCMSYEEADTSRTPFGQETLFAIHSPHPPLTINTE